MTKRKKRPFEQRLIAAMERLGPCAIFELAKELGRGCPQVCDTLKELRIEKRAYVAGWAAQARTNNLIPLYGLGNRQDVQKPDNCHRLKKIGKEKQKVELNQEQKQNRRLLETDRIFRDATRKVVMARAEA